MSEKPAKMKIGIQTWGSRGDINPWIALGRGLTEAGHEVTLIYTSYTDDDFYQYSTDGFQVSSTKKYDPDSGAYEKVTSKSVFSLEPAKLTTYMLGEIYSLFKQEVQLAADELCQNNDLIIYYTNSYEVATFADKYNVPRVAVMPYLELSPYNPHVTYADENLNRHLLKPINDLRDTLGMVPIQNVRTDVLCSKELNLMIYSKIFHRDIATNDDLYKCTGYLQLKPKEQLELPTSLKYFLEEGAPPIFLSMGSLAFFESDASLLDIFLEAAMLSNCRVIIQARWDMWPDEVLEERNVYLIDYIDHSMIFPHCAGVVHHGGAGTTHTVLLSGCPSIVVAYAWDQFYWGEELVKLGTAPCVLKRKYLNSLQLAGAMSSLLSDPNYKTSADFVRLKMKREKGVMKSVKLIEEFMEHKMSLQAS